MQDGSTSGSLTTVQTATQVQTATKSVSVDAKAAIPSVVTVIPAGATVGVMDGILI